MTVPTTDPRSLATVVARAARMPRAARVLLVDLDGTLAPIAARPEDAEVPADALDGLDRLCGAGWTIAIVSGRSASSARRLVPLTRVRVFGSHGLEGPWPERRRPRVDPRTAGRLARLGRSAESLAERTPGAWVERKPAGFAIHDRAVEPARRTAFRRAVRDWIEPLDLDGIEVLPGKRIVEFRAAGVHKGRVLEALGFDRPSRHDPSLVALGDDRTDEDLFRALEGRGLAVRVGRRGGVTSARLRLASPKGVASFLRQLADASSRGTA